MIFEMFTPALSREIGREGLAVFVLAQVVAFTAAARVFVKGIGGERHLVPDPAADQIGHSGVQESGAEEEDREHGDDRR